MKCSKCGYEWASKSRMSYASCPNCLRKTKNSEVAVVQGIVVEGKLYNMRVKYEKFIKDCNAEPIINEDTGEPETVMSYEEWLKKAIV